MTQAETARRVVVLTGGSSGIGLASARALVAAGHSLDVLGRRGAEGFRASAGDLADRVAYHPVDVTDVDRAAAVVRQIAVERGRLDVLVNNAGTMSFENAHEATPAAVRSHLATNLEAPILLSAAAISVMVEQTGGGAILNVASVAGLKATPKLAVYAASKAGLVHYTRSIAAEYAGRKIRANALCPGAVRTNLTSRLMFSMIEKSVPLGRLQTAEEVARLVVWLVSDEAASVTGAVFSMDGGMSL